MNIEESNLERKQLDQEQKVRQKLFLEYLLDPFITYEEAEKLSGIRHQFPSHIDQQEYPSTVPVGKLVRV